MFKKLLFNTLPYLLLITLLISSFSVCSFASGVDGWTAEEFYIKVDRTDRQNISSDITSQCTITPNASVGGVNPCLKIQTPAGAVKDDYLLAYRWPALNNTEYNFRASFFCNFSKTASLTILLRIRVNGSVYRTQTLYDVAAMSTVNNDWVHLNFNFTPDLSGITTGYECELLVRVETNLESANASSIFAISNDIYLQSVSDNSVLLGGILSWLDKLYYSIVGGTDSAGVSHVGIVAAISNGFSTLSNNVRSYFSQLTTSLSGFFSDLGTAINNKLQSVQNAITSAIDGIQQWFINLGNRIGDFFTMLKNYLLYFQHPVTLNNDGVPVDSNGNPVYTNPFADTLDSIVTYLNGVYINLSGFVTSINSVNQNVTNYLSTFTSIFDRFNNGFELFGIIIGLALTFIVIRKIIGR